MVDSQTWNEESQEVYYKKIVSKFMLEARTKICNSCEFSGNGMCLRCGCPLDKKLINADEQCPIHKW